MPSTDLVAITLEGFDEQDEQSLGIGAVEIADLVRYHGASNVGQAHRATVVQFKYSIADAETAVRAADFASTLRKFAATDAEFRTEHGDPHVFTVVRYEFATNRPIHDNLRKALAAVVGGTPSTGDVSRQSLQRRPRHRRSRIYFCAASASIRSMACASSHRAEPNALHRQRAIHLIVLSLFPCSRTPR